MNIETLHKLKDITVLVFGDYMVDRYINGKVNRISPEAPVPVIEVTNEFQKLGGAGNVINNIISLGGNVRALGCIGKDNAGDFIIKYFDDKKIDISYFKQFYEISTIIKTRIVSKSQQFLRIDEEKKENLLKIYVDYVKENIDSIFNGINSLVISDYGKGNVTEEISQLLINEANVRKIPVIIDPKGKKYEKYKNATICTPNTKELSDVVNANLETEEAIKKYGYELLKNLNLKYLVITRSEKGISVIDQKGNKSDYPAQAKEVIDVSGAGDTVVTLMALLSGIGVDIDSMCHMANMAASVVVSKFGTSTVSLNELISNTYFSDKFKYQNLNSLKYLIKDLHDKGKKVVFTNGCFDMLHVGHLHSFKEAKKYGDVLIVAVNSDKSVKENKGDLRPIISEDDRIEMLCSIEYIDYVIKMEEKNPVNIIKELKPDISIKGEDWKNKEVPEKAIIESYGGKIKFIKLNPNHSTSSIIDKVITVYGKK